MTADEDLLWLLRFVFDRFDGVIPEDKMLENAIKDWRKEAYGPEKERSEAYRRLVARYTG